MMDPYGAPLKVKIDPYPRCSMYGIFTNICPKNQPNVGKYTIHGASGYGSYLKSSREFVENQRGTQKKKKHEHLQKTCRQIARILNGLPHMHNVHFRQLLNMIKTSAPEWQGNAVPD